MLFFNDYTRTVDLATPWVAPCNADTAVYSSLAARQVHKRPFDHFDMKTLGSEQSPILPLIISTSWKTGVSMIMIAMRLQP